MGWRWFSKFRRLYNSAAITNNPGGGGGGGGATSSSALPGAAGGTGPAGGGAGSTNSSGAYDSYGGHAGYGTVGEGGSYGGIARGSSGSGTSGGAGGNGSSNILLGGGGGGGGTFGDSSFLYQKAFLGAGGGGSGYPGIGNGQSAGGIIYIGVNIITNNGGINSLGNTQVTGRSGNASGGSIIIRALSSSNNGTISTRGGYYQSTYSALNVAGNGRSYLSYVSKSGSNPAYTALYQEQKGYSSPGAMGSISAASVGLRIDTESGAKPSQLNWIGASSSAGQKILFKVRAGDSQAELDQNQCYGPGTGTPGSGLDSGCNNWTTAGKFFSQINGQANSSNTIDSDIPPKDILKF
jgi:hypothetical protein